ncbi:MAG: hypothetical protein J7L07_08965 [Candidatus Odinarchaeota archaeon]|nr:hypothetical protein [Candidatus Odinarchaeota archaeon]
MKLCNKSKDITVVVIDACAIEEITKSEDILKCIQNKICLLVFGKSIQMSEFERRLTKLKKEGKERIVMMFARIMRSAYTFVNDQKTSEKFNFEFEGEKPKVKDMHLFKIAKAGALRIKEKHAVIITFARDVLRVKKAKIAIR